MFERGNVGEGPYKIVESNGERVPCAECPKKASWCFLDGLCRPCNDDPKSPCCMPNLIIQFDSINYVYLSVRSLFQ